MSNEHTALPGMGGMAWHGVGNMKHGATSEIIYMGIWHGNALGLGGLVMVLQSNAKPI
jgi:hypothetical protein